MADLEALPWVELGVFGADAKIRAEPFEAIEIDVAAWWVDLAQDDEVEG